MADECNFDQAKRAEEMLVLTILAVDFSEGLVHVPAALGLEQPQT